MTFATSSLIWKTVIHFGESKRKKLLDYSMKLHKFQKII
jgi:hypothetical protein